MSQTSVEKGSCTSCKEFAAGQTVMGGFVCEDCIKVFMIQNQLWRISVTDRNTLVFQKALKN